MPTVSVDNNYFHNINYVRTRESRGDFPSYGLILTIGHCLLTRLNSRALTIEHTVMNSICIPAYGVRYVNILPVGNVIIDAQMITHKSTVHTVTVR